MLGPIFDVALPDNPWLRLVVVIIMVPVLLWAHAMFVFTFFQEGFFGTSDAGTMLFWAGFVAIPVIAIWAIIDGFRWG